MRKTFDYLAALRPRHMRKALAAGTGAAGIAFGKALLDLHVSHGEFGLIASAFVGTFFVTFVAPANEPQD